MLRHTGIEAVGDMPFGTHFCHFYETKEDLLGTLVPYFQAGLETREYCVWVLADRVTAGEAWDALEWAVPGLDRLDEDRSLEILDAWDWYMGGGAFDMRRVTDGWNRTLERALARGYDGIRVSGDTIWLQKAQWADFCAYENELNESIGNQPMTVLCTYPLASSGASELLDVARTHQFAIAKRQGRWEVVETPQLKQAKAEIARLNEQLERRVVERTVALEAAVAGLRETQAQQQQAAEALHQAQADLSHVARLTTMGELTTSLAHELNQPLAAIVGNGSACLRWLERTPPDLGEVSHGLQRLIRDAKRAGDVIAHARALVKKSTGEKAPVDVAEMIREVLALAMPELERRQVLIEKDLPDELATVMADRVQLQQVVLNLVMNGIDAMAGVSDRPRRLRIACTSREVDDGPGVLVSVQDAGVGTAGEDLGRLFDAFYTTKPSGLGMGLSISRSIVQAHRGRLWVSRNADHGLTFHFVLPAGRPSGA